jgi:hypothetical protein
VAIETVLSVTALELQVPGGLTAHSVPNLAGQHLLWALLIGPFFLMFYEIAHGKLEKWAEDRKAERNGS